MSYPEGLVVRYILDIGHLQLMALKNVVAMLCPENAIHD